MSNPAISRAQEAAPAPLHGVLAALSLSMLLASLGTSIANVGLPTLAHAFGATFQQVQWIVLAYLLAITTLIVGAGRLGDLVGRRRLLGAGVALFGVSSASCAMAPTLGLLVAARAAQGVGASVMMALTLAFVGETVPKDRTGSAMGLLGTMSAIGTALGPSLGGLLIAAIGWRSLFAVQVPLAVAAWWLVRRYLPADRPATGELRFDMPGTLLLASALGTYALAMTLGRGHFGLPNGLALLAAAVLLGLFVWVEARVASPLIRLAMLREPVLAGSLATGALVSTVMMATLVVGPFHLARALGLDAAGVGLVMSCGPLAAAFAGVPAGRLVDRFGAQRVLQLGLAAAVTGCGALAASPAALGVAGYVLPLVVLTLGYAVFQAANNTAALAGVPADRRGVVSGMLNLSRNLGLVTGASVMGAVFASATGAADISAAAPAAVEGGMRVTFAVAAALVAAALAIAVAGARIARDPAAA